MNVYIGLSLLILSCDDTKTKSRSTLGHIFNPFRWNTAWCGSRQLIDWTGQDPFTCSPWKPLWLVLAVCPAKRWIAVQWVLRCLNVWSWLLKSFCRFQKFILLLSSSVNVNKEPSLTCDLPCWMFWIFCALALSTESWAELVPNCGL